MTTIGETLRRTRLSRNLDLDQISNATKISSRLLQAIEAEQFDKLPGGVFTKSFVRQYARFLGLDDEEMVEDLERVLEPPQGQESSNRGRPERDDIRLPRVEEWQIGPDSRFHFSSSLPALAMVVLVMLICSALYTWWQRSRNRPSPVAANLPGMAANRSTAPAPVTAAPPPSTAESAPSPAARASVVETGATQIPSPAQSGPSTTGSAASPSANPASDTTEPTAPETKAQPADTPRPSSPASQAPPNPNAALRLVVTADEPTWVSVRADGKFLFTGTLQPNETRTVDAEETVLFRLGNAGGVTFTLNGKPIGSTGPKGKARTLQFTPGGFSIVPSAPKPPVEGPDPL
jgi:cytoskeleton protein RodZ